MSKTIWAIFHGSYSDYGVEAIFTNKKAAEQTFKDLGGTDNENDSEYYLEEMNLYDTPVKVTPFYTMYAGGLSDNWHVEFKVEPTPEWKSQGIKPGKIDAWENYSPIGTYGSTYAWGDVLVQGWNEIGVRKEFADRWLKYREQYGILSYIDENGEKKP